LAAGRERAVEAEGVKNRARQIAVKLIFCSTSWSRQAPAMTRINSRKNIFEKLIPAHSRAFITYICVVLSVLRRRRERRCDGGAGCGCLRAGLVSRLLGGFGPRPTGHYGPCARSSLSLAGLISCGGKRGPEPTIAAVERREACAALLLLAKAQRCAPRLASVAILGRAFRRSAPSCR
jgi:hypothetical protein